MLRAVLTEVARLKCQVFHWRRDRDSFGARCSSCGIYW